MSTNFRTLHSLDDYFQTRDFTINECLLVGSVVLVTVACVRDSRHQIVRPTEFELYLNQWGETCLSGKLAAKARRFVAERWVRFSEAWTLVDCFDDDVTAFDIALQLDRAMESDTEVTEHFIELMAEHFEFDLEEARFSREGLIFWAQKALGALLREGTSFFKFDPLQDGWLAHQDHPQVLKWELRPTRLPMWASA